MFTNDEYPYDISLCPRGTNYRVVFGPVEKLRTISDRSVGGLGLLGQNTQKYSRNIRSVFGEYRQYHLRSSTFRGITFDILNPDNDNAHVILNK